MNIAKYSLMSMYCYMARVDDPSCYAVRFAFYDWPFIVFI